MKPRISKLEILGISVNDAWKAPVASVNVMSNACCVPGDPVPSTIPTLMFTVIGPVSKLPVSVLVNTISISNVFVVTFDTTNPVPLYIVSVETLKMFALSPLTKP